MPRSISQNYFVKALSRALSFFSGCPQWIQNVFISVNTLIREEERNRAERDKVECN